MTPDASLSPLASVPRAVAARADRAVLTLAVGRPIFYRLAVNLARSFKRWHRDSSIKFAIVTDCPEAIPSDLHDVQVIPIAPGQYGTGFSPKLHIDRLAPADRTLFLDADCLCVGPLDSVFDRFAGRAVSVIGGHIRDGEWFGDVHSVCRRFAVDKLPKFNGGVYYVERGERSRRVYETARQLEPLYDDIGLQRLRGKPNEELLMAIAMAIHGESGIAEDGSIMAEPLNFASGLWVDVLGGRARLLNLPEHPQYRPHWPLREARPLIVHFLGSFTDRGPYAVEEMRLDRVMARGWPAWAATLLATATRRLPYLATESLKNLLRPAYHRLFGYRPVPVSERI